MNNFLLHYWLSKYNYVAEKKLFKDIKSNIKKKTTIEFLQDLSDTSEIYRAIHEPEYRKWKKEESQIRESLSALMLFRVRQQLPIQISLLREYFENKLTLNQIKTIISSIENFHFIFTAITSQRSSGGISQMYSSNARILLDCKDKNQRAQHLKEFKEKLRDRIPYYGEFEVNFLDKIYLSNNTKDRPLVQYILKKIHKYENPKSVTDYDKMTIEHIAPQNPEDGAYISDEYVGMIGNMILVPEEVNAKLANKAFADKKRILKREGIKMDDNILEAKDWAGKEIEERTIALAGVAYHEIWGF